MSETGELQCAECSLPFGGSKTENHCRAMASELYLPPKDPLAKEESITEIWPKNLEPPLRIRISV